MVPDLTWGASRPDIDRTIALMRDAGIRWLRMNVSWDSLEPDRKGAYNTGMLTNVDYAAAQARAAGMQIVMPMAEGVPYWASADPAKTTGPGGQRTWRVAYRPSSYQDYADAFAYLVRRYAPQGVHVFEVWNEPNLEAFWPSGPDGAEYAAMLRAAYPAIHAADPSARVLLGGLSPRDSYDFMSSVYAAGGAPYFDDAAYHVYPASDPDSCWNGSDGRPAFDTWCALDEFRRIMVANGDGAKGVWITEYGYSTCANADAACHGVGLGESAQAAYLVRMQQKWDTPSYAYVRSTFLYQFRDWTGDAAISPGDWNENLGIVRRDFTPKPAYAAIKAYNTTPASPSPPQSADQPPTVELTAPATAAAASGVRPSSSVTVTRPRTSTTLTIGTSRKARTAQPRRRPRPVATGKVLGARSGRVKVLLRRFDARRGRWVSAKAVDALVGASGRFRARLPVGRGRWSAYALYRGAPASRSRTVRFTVS